MADPRQAVMEAPARLDEATEGGGVSDLASDLVPAAPPQLFAQIDAELDNAATLTVDERRELGDVLNRRLAAIPKNGGRPVADALLRLLEGGRLGDIVDSEGRTVRAAATEALLSLGYPYALELSPDDLDHLRQGGGFKTPGATVLTALILVTALAGFEAITGSALDQTLSQVHAALTIASAIAVAATRPLTRARKWAVLSLLIAGAEGVLLGALGTPAALVSGLAAIVAAALMSKKR